MAFTIITSKTAFTVLMDGSPVGEYSTMASARRRVRRLAGDEGYVLYIK